MAMTGDMTMTKRGKILDMFDRKQLQTLVVKY